MKIAYFDCPTGISGNMILGALLDAGLDPDFLKREIGNLRINFAVSNLKEKAQRGNRDVQSQVSELYKLQISKVKKAGLAGTYVKVKLKTQEEPRYLKDILSIIKRSRLSRNIKVLSSRIFRRLAEAEAKVHGIPISKVHFHEVGAIDAIIDIVGACIGIEKLGIEQIYCSPLPHGKGEIKSAHGFLPNPAPATVELLKGISTYGTDIAAELVTPTGVAIISTLAESFGDIPRMEVSSIGYGAGSFNLPLPNLLRIFIGEAQIPAEKDAILQIETNIDDMDPRLYQKAISKIMQAGALDAYLAPIMMKKKRKAVQLVILTAPENRDAVIEKIFEQTTTLGVRVYLVAREKLSRKIVGVKTKYGKAKVKLGLLGKKVLTIAPEFEDYRRIARKHHIPIRRAYNSIRLSP
jgi:hypothetical protein